MVVVAETGGGNGDGGSFGPNNGPNDSPSGGPNDSNGGGGSGNGGGGSFAPNDDHNGFGHNGFDHNDSQNGFGHNDGHNNGNGAPITNGVVRHDVASDGPDVYIHGGGGGGEGGGGGGGGNNNNGGGVLVTVDNNDSDMDSLELTEFSCIDSHNNTTTSTTYSSHWSATCSWADGCPWLPSQSYIGIPAHAMWCH